MSNFKGQALNYNVVIKEVELENVSTTGLDFSNEADKNDKQKTGVIVSVGLGCPKFEDGTFTINPGELVMFDKYKSTSLTLDGEFYKIVYYADIVMKF